METTAKRAMSDLTQIETEFVVPILSRQTRSAIAGIVDFTLA
jgi:hypothetical protein